MLRVLAILLISEKFTETVRVWRLTVNKSEQTRHKFTHVGNVVRLQPAIQNINARLHEIYIFHHFRATRFRDDIDVAIAFNITPTLFYFKTQWQLVKLYFLLPRQSCRNTERTERLFTNKNCQSRVKNRVKRPASKVCKIYQWNIGPLNDAVSKQLQSTMDTRKWNKKLSNEFTCSTIRETASDVTFPRFHGPFSLNLQRDISFHERVEHTTTRHWACIAGNPTGKEKKCVQTRGPRIYRVRGLLRVKIGPRKGKKGCLIVHSKVAASFAEESQKWKNFSDHLWISLNAEALRGCEMSVIARTLRAYLWQEGILVLL